jgi:phage FluMu protein Com
MKMKCPQCNSTKTRKLKAIYEEEIADTQTTRSYKGIHFGKHGISSEFGNFSSGGRIETRLAQRVAPPLPKNVGKVYEQWALVIAVAIAGILIKAIWSMFTVAIGFSPLEAWVQILSLAAVPLIIILVAATCFLLWRRNRVNARYKKVVYLPALTKWERQARCYRCGHIFDSTSVD